MKLTLKDEMFILSYPNDAKEFLRRRKAGQAYGIASIFSAPNPKAPSMSKSDDRMRNNTEEMGTLSRVFGKSDKFIPKSKGDIERRIELLKRHGKVEKQDRQKMMEDPHKADISDIFSVEQTHKDIQKGLKK